MIYPIYFLVISHLLTLGFHGAMANHPLARRKVSVSSVMGIPESSSRHGS